MISPIREQLLLRSRTRQLLELPSDAQRHTACCQQSTESNNYRFQAETHSAMGSIRNNLPVKMDWSAFQEKGQHACKPCRTKNTASSINSHMHHRARSQSSVEDQLRIQLSAIIDPEVERFLRCSVPRRHVFRAHRYDM